MSQLQLDLRAHDLPPRWDGHPVEWENWAPELVVTHLDRDPCAQCGSKERLRTRGIRSIRHDDNVIRFRRGRPTRPRDLRAVLCVTRCVGCRLDVVFDPWTGQWWDLDGSDYQDAGSHAEDGAL